MSQPRRSPQLASDIGDGDWLRCWTVNVRGVRFCTRAALRVNEPPHDGKLISFTAVICGR